jgi:predicted anti-sigma-YlaC factor YlaD
MNCPEFQAQIHQFLDGEVISDSAEFDSHHRACCACRELRFAAEELARGLRLADWPTPRAGLTDRVVAAVTADRGYQVRMRQVRHRLAAVAASIALVVTVGTLVSRLKAPARPATDASLTMGHEHTSQVVGTLSLNDSMSEAGSALTSLVEMTARETLLQGQLLLPDRIPAPPIEPVDAWQQTVERPVESLRQAGQALSTGLEPVAASAQRAFLTFVDDLSPAGLAQ